MKTEKKPQTFKVIQIVDRTTEQPLPIIIPQLCKTEVDFKMMSSDWMKPLILKYITGIQK